VPAPPTGRHSTQPPILGQLSLLVKRGLPEAGRKRPPSCRPGAGSFDLEDLFCQANGVHVPVALPAVVATRGIARTSPKSRGVCQRRTEGWIVLLMCDLQQQLDIAGTSTHQGCRPALQYEQDPISPVRGHPQSYTDVVSRFNLNELSEFSGGSVWRTAVKYGWKLAPAGFPLLTDSAPDKVHGRKNLRLQVQACNTLCTESGVALAVGTFAARFPRTIRRRLSAKK